jgi:hypothetical protein
MPTYELIEDGCHFQTVRAASAEAALNRLTGRKLARTGAYNFGGDAGRHETRTIWVRIGAVNADNRGEARVRKYRLDPKAPRCGKSRASRASRGGHRWGGRTVRGHGGGVVVSEVCQRCGIERVTDTWAQDPTDGQQGLEAVCYRRPDHALL